MHTPHPAAPASQLLPPTPHPPLLHLCVSGQVLQAPSPPHEHAVPWQSITPNPIRGKLLPGPSRMSSEAPPRAATAAAAGSTSAPYRQAAGAAPSMPSVVVPAAAASAAAPRTGWGTPVASARVGSDPGGASGSDDTAHEYPSFTPSMLGPPPPLPPPDLASSPSSTSLSSSRSASSPPQGAATEEGDGQPAGAAGQEEAPAPSHVIRRIHDQVRERRTACVHACVQAGCGRMRPGQQGQGMVVGGTHFF